MLCNIIHSSKKKEKKKKKKEIKKVNEREFITLQNAFLVFDQVSQFKVSIQTCSLDELSLTHLFGAGIAYCLVDS
jgi:hypothetical protein